MAGTSLIAQAIICFFAFAGVMAARQEIRESRKLSQEMGLNYSLKQSVVDAGNITVIVLFVANLNLLTDLLPKYLASLLAGISFILFITLLVYTWGETSTRKRYEVWRYNEWLKDAKPVRSLFDDLKMGIGV